MRRNELNPPPLTQLIEHDRKCTSCGYNLKGLNTGDRCPECGSAIPLGVVDPRAGWVITDAGMDYLRAFGFGSLLMAMCVVPMVLGILWTLVEAPWENGLTLWPGSAACISTVGWVMGVWIITRPRPSRDDGISSSVEWRGVRWWARCAQVAWLVGLPVLMYGAFYLSPEGAAVSASAAIPMTSIIAKQLVILGLILFLVAFIGLAPLALYMSRLAHWGNDTTLADRLRLVPYALGLGGALMALMVLIRDGIGYKGGGIVMVFMGCVASLCLVLALTQFGAALFSFASLGRWSAASRQVRMAIDARRSRVILERIESTKAKPMDLTGAVVQGHKPAKAQGKVLERPEGVQPFDLAP